MDAKSIVTFVKVPECQQLETRHILIVELTHFKICIQQKHLHMQREKKPGLSINRCYLLESFCKYDIL